MQKAFVRHTADLVDAAMDVRNRSAPLCMDQDIYADLAVANPTLFEWFTTSGDGYGWGWKDAKLLTEPAPLSGSAADIACLRIAAVTPSVSSECVQILGKLGADA